MRIAVAWTFAWLLAAALAVLLVEGVLAQGDELLGNGGFEDGADPWKAYPPEALTTLAGAGLDGSIAGVFTARAASRDRVSQCVPAWEGGEYELAGYLARPLGSPLVSVRVDTGWYDQDGCEGNEVYPSRNHQTVILEQADNWYFFEARPFQGAMGSRSARLNVLLDLPSDEDAIVYLDDFSFVGPAAPSPTPTPTTTPPLTPTLTPTPTPSATPTPTATVPPQSSPTPVTTPKPTASPGPSSSSTPRATGTAAPSPPSVPTLPRSGDDGPSPPSGASQLINGGFEEADAGGKPHGWRKYGGEFERSSGARQEGRFSAAFRSRTKSTKWAFQAVQVDGGKAYELAGYALKNDADVEAAYLRLSWYASADGSGQAIGSVDSTARLIDDSPDFRLLTTGAVVAPNEASSAKIRLMLDPVNEALAIVHFDAISFVETEMPPPSAEETPVPTVALGDESPQPPPPAPDQESPPLSPPILSVGSSPSPTPSSDSSSSTDYSGEVDMPAPPLSSTPSPAPLRSTLGATPSSETDRDETPTGAARQPSTGGQRLAHEPGQTPAALYRERRPSEPAPAPGREEGDTGGVAVLPAALGMAGLAVALGLSGGLYVWHRRRYRARLR